MSARTDRCTLVRARPEGGFMALRRLPLGEREAAATAERARTLIDRLEGGASRWAFDADVARAMVDLRAARRGLPVSSPLRRELRELAERLDRVLTEGPQPIAYR